MPQPPRPPPAPRPFRLHPQRLHHPPAHLLAHGPLWRDPTLLDALVVEVASNLTSGCAADLEGLGLDQSLVGSIPGLVGMYWDVTLEAGCTKG